MRLIVPSRNHRLFAAAVAVNATLMLHAFAFKSRDSDQAIFSRAGQRFLQGSPLYVEADANDDGGSAWTDRSYKYAPGAALLFTPFAVLPERVGQLLFLLANLLGLVVAAIWAQRAAGLERLTWLPLLLVAPLAHHLFALGQSDGLLLGLFAGSELVRQRRPALAGCLGAAAVLMKITFALPVFALAALRRDRGIKWTLGAVPLLVLPVVLRYGPAGAVELHRDWLQLLSQTTPPLLCRASNQGAWAMSCAWPGVAGAVAMALVLGVLISLSPRRGEGRSEGAGSSPEESPLTPALSPTEEREIFPLAAGLVFCAAFLSPLCWRSTLVCALPAFALIAQRLALPAAKAALAAALALAVPFYELGGNPALSFALGARWYGVFAWLACVLALASARQGR